jgi:hypothetical protein
VPATRLERVLVVLGLFGCAVLAFLAVTAWQDYRDSQPSAQPSPAAASTVAETEPVGAVAGTTVEDVPRSTPAATATLELVAARGDSWLEARVGSAQGEGLFLDTLDQGERERFREKRLWLRFGAAQNVDATLNGDAVQLPPGTTTVVVTRDGVRPAG